MSGKVYTKKVGLFAKKVVRLFLIPFAAIIFMIGWVLFISGGRKKPRKK